MARSLFLLLILAVAPCVRSGQSPGWIRRPVDSVYLPWRTHA